MTWKRFVIIPWAGVAGSGQAARRADWRIWRGHHPMRQFSRRASSPWSLLPREFGYRATLKTYLCAISCCCTIAMHTKSSCYPSSFLDNTFTLSSDADLTNVFLMYSVTSEHVHNPLSVIAFLEMRFVVCTCEDNVSGVQASSFTLLIEALKHVPDARRVGLRISDACCCEECK